MGARRFDAPRITPGAGSFAFAGHPGRSGKPMTVRYYRPPGFTDATPIVFVMHGVRRDAKNYRDNWAATAEQLGFLLLCPEFDRADYPRRAAYQLGNLADNSGEPLPEERWAFRAIENLFDSVREATGNASGRYRIYGHSAGGQFVHRLALFLPGARYAAAVAANTGWYTMPTLEGERFPYGLRGSASTPEKLRKAFGNRLVILLGEHDTSAEGPFLRRSKNARRQGENRLERGRFFFATARKEAARLGATLNWTLQTVPGAAHFDPQMMPAAARSLFRGPLTEAPGGRAG